MGQDEKRFSGDERCRHCGNSAPMEIVAEYSGVRRQDDYPHSDLSCEAGTVYQLLLCPACQGISLRSYWWHELTMEASDIKFETLYPTQHEPPVGLPESISRAYDAALEVRSIDPNAYGVLLGRVLELVCLDRGASGRSLGRKLGNLSSRGEIPVGLVSVADGLRNLRNVGAHAGLGELTAAELPIMDSLCVAILEYVYSAPFLAKQAEARLAELTSGSLNQDAEDSVNSRNAYPNS